MSTTNPYDLAIGTRVRVGGWMTGTITAVTPHRYVVTSDNWRRMQYETSRGELFPIPQNTER